MTSHDAQRDDGRWGVRRGNGRLVLRAGPCLCLSVSLSPSLSLFSLFSLARFSRAFRAVVFWLSLRCVFGHRTQWPVMTTVTMALARQRQRERDRQTERERETLVAVVFLGRRSTASEATQWLVVRLLNETDECYTPDSDCIHSFTQEPNPPCRKLPALSRSIPTQRAGSLPHP